MSKEDANGLSYKIADLENYYVDNVLSWIERYSIKKESIIHIKKEI